MQKRPRQAGFSLIQLSIILAVGGLMLAASLPGGGAGNELAKTRITLERMAAIEQATQAFMGAHQRRPYPSDISVAFSSVEFGKEINPPPIDYSAAAPTSHFTYSSSGNYTTVSGSTTATYNSGSISGIYKGWVISGTGIPNSTSQLVWIEGIPTASTLTMNLPANASATTGDLFFRNPLVAGGVPTKSLNLPDEYAIDGFGRRMIYMVDQRVTTTSGCAALQNNQLRGALSLSNGNAGGAYNFDTGIYDNVMWSLLSYGKDGQGAVGIQGSSIAIGRIKTGNVDDSTLNNAFYDSSQVKSYLVSGLVNKAPTTTFDDIVWVNQATKNTCAMGSVGTSLVSSFRDFHVAGGAVATGAAMAATGDINGDSWPDLIFGIPKATADAGVIRVLLGKKDGWPDPTASFDTTTLDGTNGFTITKGTLSAGFGTTLAVGDVNGDGYDDIIAGSSSGGTGYAIIFGGASWPSSYVVGTTTTPTTATTIAGMYAAVTSTVAVGDVNSDGYDDIALPYDAGVGNWAVGLIYGKATADWTSDGNFTLGNAWLDGTSTKGVYFNVADDPVGPPVTPNATTGDVSFGRSGSADLGKRLLAICDVDGDGYKDLIVPGVKIDATISPQRLYVVLGQSGNWTPTSGGLIDVSSHANSKQLTFPTLAEGAAPTNDIKALGCKDIDSDGYDDILTYLRANAGAQETIYTYRGRTGYAASDINANYDISFDLTANAPVWQDTNAAVIPQITFADVNNDGKNDIIVSRGADDPWTSTTGTTFTLNWTNTGAQQADAGTNYILYQPSACYSAACWGALPNLNKDFYDDYAYYDGTAGIKIIGMANSFEMVEASTDINKDGKTDLIFSSRWGTVPITYTGGHVLFGKTSWPVTYDMECTTDTSPADHCPNQIGTK